MYTRKKELLRRDLMQVVRNVRNAFEFVRVNAKIGTFYPVSVFESYGGSLFTYLLFTL
jgi:hypothetical protein